MAVLLSPFLMRHRTFECRRRAFVERDMMCSVDQKACLQGWSPLFESPLSADGSDHLLSFHLSLTLFTFPKMPENTDTTASAIASTPDTINIDTERLTMTLTLLKSILDDAETAASSSIQPMVRSKLDKLRIALKTAAPCADLAYDNALSYEPVGKAEMSEDDTESVTLVPSGETESAGAASGTDGIASSGEEGLNTPEADHAAALHVLRQTLVVASHQCGLAKYEVPPKAGTIDSDHPSFYKTIRIFPNLEADQREVSRAFGLYFSTLAAMESSEGKGAAQ